MTAPLSGGSWTTAATLLEGPAGIVARNGEFHLPDLLGSVATVASGTGAAVASRSFDSAGVLRGSSGSATTPYGAGRTGDEGLTWQGSSPVLAGVGVEPSLVGRIACKACIKLGNPIAIAACMIACNLLISPKPRPRPKPRPDNDWRNDFRKCFQGCVKRDCSEMVEGPSRERCVEDCLFGCSRKHNPSNISVGAVQ